MLCLRIIAGAGVSITKPVVNAAIERVAEPLLLKLRNGLIKMFPGERNFSEKSMRQRQLRIQLQGLRSKLLSYRQVFPAEQHARSQKIGRRRLWRKAILIGES